MNAAAEPPVDAPALEPLTGGCLCGAVRYQARATHRDGYYCHCRMCQLAFGNTRAAFFNIRKAELTWAAAQPSYFASSRIARRGFCARCGTPLSFEYFESPNIDLSAGSLDDPSMLAPKSISPSNRGSDPGMATTAFRANASTHRRN